MNMKIFISPHVCTLHHICLIVPWGCLFQVSFKTFNENGTLGHTASLRSTVTAAIQSPKLKLSLVMTSLLLGGGGGGSLVSTKTEVEFGHKFASTKTEVEFGHDKFAFRGGGVFHHDQTQLQFWY